MAGARPVLFSEPLVDVGVLAAARLGIALPIVNWAGAPVTALTSADATVRLSNAMLATGGRVAVGRDGRWPTRTFELDVADAVILW